MEKHLVMVDERTKKLIEVDTKEPDLIAAGNSAIEEFFIEINELGSRIGNYKVLAIEGTTLTLLGNLTYDMNNDRVTLEKPIMFVGGGLNYIKEILASEYNHSIRNAYISAGWFVYLSFLLLC